MTNKVRHTPNTKGRTGKRNAWTEAECREVCIAYLYLLDAQRDERKVNKSALRRSVLPNLNGRSAGSYEAKMQNVSTFRHEYGLEIVKGYKALNGAQNLLGQVLASIDTEFAAVAEFTNS